MLLTQNVTNTPASSFGSAAHGQPSSPAAGGFDFMSYLLGMQTMMTPGDIRSENSVLPQGPSVGLKKTADPEDALVSLLSQGQKKTWSPILQGAAGVAVSGQNPLLTQPLNPKQVTTDLARGNQSSLSVEGMPTNATLSSQSRNPQISGEKRFQGIPGAVTDASPLNLKSGNLMPDVKGEEKTSVEPGKSSMRDIALQRYAEHGSRSTQGPGNQSLEKQGELSAKLNVDSHAHDKASSRKFGSAYLVSQEGSRGPSLDRNRFGNEIKKDENRPDGHSTNRATLNSQGTVDFAGFQGGSTSILNPVSVSSTPGSSTASHHAEVTVPQLFTRVDSMIQQGGGKMTVSLNPPHLGKVEIQVTTKGKKVEIAMRSANDLAKVALESHLGDLKQSMHAQNLVLSKMDVQVAHEGNSHFNGTVFTNLSNNGHSFQQSGGFTGRQSEHHVPTREPVRIHEPSAPITVAAAAGRPAVQGSGRVDIRI